MRRFAIPMATVLVLLTGLLGCELSPPLQPLGSTASPKPTTSASPVVPTPTPAPTATPTPSPAIKALRGHVVDRNGQRLPGARVALGAFSVLTAEASESATDERGQTVTLEAGEFILLNVPAGEQTLTLSYDDASRSVPVTVASAGVTRADGLYLPVYGAVPSGSKALTASTTLPLIKVQKASADAQLVFLPETFAVTFKAPPNGIGDQIGAYSVTYFQSDGTPLAPAEVWPLSTPVDVEPAVSGTKSGPAETGNFHILDGREVLRNAWTTSNANGYVRLAFFNSRGGRPIVDRSGEPLIVEVSCTLVP